MKMELKEDDAAKPVQPPPKWALRFAELQDRAEARFSAVRKSWFRTQMDPIDVMEKRRVYQWMEEFYRFVHTVGRAGALFGSGWRV
jgi:hypothetical protein